MAYTTIIGMEVHVALNTKTKMFCPCPNNPESQEPNSQICDVCTGQPGSLPTPNKEAIISTIKVGKALGCTILPVSKFDRKQYFYPDLPKGYQISQYDEPIAKHGKIELQFILEKNIRDTAIIGIERVHLEEDTAKLTHKNDKTLVDFNRSGLPLVEIVTKPDFMSATEAKKYCQELQTLLRYLGVSDAHMEKGQMRCEANISVQTAGTFEIVDGVVKPLRNAVLNPKVELKNLNSFKSVERGIVFEIERQISLLEKSQTWTQQTRGWDEVKQETVLQRKKGGAADYRYFPEPDIPPFHPEEISGTISLPELPLQKQQRFHSEYGFSYADSYILTQQKVLANFTESVMSEITDWLHTMPEVKGSTETIREQKMQKIARLAGTWISNKLLGLLNEQKKSIQDFAVSPENMAELIALIYTNKINAINAQKILVQMVDSSNDLDPTHIMEEKGYGMVQDTEKITEIVADVINTYPKQVAEYQSGKEAVLAFLIGMVMKASEGTVDPKVAEEILQNTLQN